MLRQAQLSVGRRFLALCQGALRHSKHKEFVKLFPEGYLAHQNKFGHHQAIKFIEEHLLSRFPFVDAVETLASRYIGSGKHKPFFVFTNQCYIIVLRVMQ